MILSTIHVEWSFDVFFILIFGLYEALDVLDLEFIYFLICKESQYLAFLAYSVPTHGVLDASYD